LPAGAPGLPAKYMMVLRAVQPEPKDSVPYRSYPIIKGKRVEEK